jgi:hypothetical protein
MDNQDDYSASIDTTAVLTAGVPLAARFDQSGDVDWFRFHAEAGQRYAFYCDDPLAAIRAFGLYDAGGKMLSFSTSGFVADRSGDYFVAVSGFPGHTGGYTMSYNQVVDDYSADDSSPGQIALGGQAGGQIQFSGDVDRFKMSMEAGRIYTFEIDSVGTSWSRHPDLHLVDADGHAVGAYPGVQSDGTVVVSVSPEQSGLYSLDVMMGFYDGDRPTAYTLKALSSVVDDYGNTVATAGRMDAGATVHGAMDTALDVDVIKVDLVAGTTYAFALAADGSPLSSELKLKFDLADSAGTNIVDQWVNSVPNYSYTPTKSGSYYISVANLTVAPLNYTLSVTPSADDYGANAAGAGRLDIGGSVNASLEAGGGDRNWFGVALKAGTTYWFKLSDSGTEGSVGGNAELHLLDAGGKLLTGTTGGYLPWNGITVAYVPATSGTYYVEVAGYQRSTGSYQLQASLGTRDDVGNDRAHAAALADGVPSNGALEVTLDQDVYKFAVVAGQTYGLTLAPGANTGNLGVTASDAAGNAVTLRNPSIYTDTGSYLFEAASSGDYYFTVKSTAPGASLGGSYALTALSYGSDDYGATPQTSATLAIGGTLQGKLNFADDKDWARVHLEAGRTYVFDLEGAASGGGTLDTGAGAAGFALVNQYGYAVADRDGGGYLPRITYVAASTGDYYLQAGASAKQGSYTMVATQTSGDLSAPELSSASISNGATGVGLNAKFSFEFDELVTAGNTSGVRLLDASGAEFDLHYAGYRFGVHAAGHRLVIDGDGYLQPGNYTLELPAGIALDLAGNAAHLPSRITFTTVAAASQATSGNDLLVGSGTGQHIDGGAGVDTVVYPNRDMDIGHSGNQVTVKAPGAAAADTLSGIERLVFPDHAWALDVDGHGGQTYRLYTAAFARLPDLDGLGFWMAALDRGMSLHDVAAGFVQSDEFRTLYGTNPSDEAFVNLLYQNVLHRAPEAQGLSFWLTALHNGLTHADALIGFSESPENQAALIGSIGNGFSYHPYG